MKYFSSCKTPEERKAKWKELAKQYHPDRGGDVVVMQEINRQYAEEEEDIESRMFWYSSRYRKGTWESMTEEVEPEVSYYKRNNIDPYAHVSKSTKINDVVMDPEGMDEFEVLYNRVFKRR